MDVYEGIIVDDEGEVSAKKLYLLFGAIEQEINISLKPKFDILISVLCDLNLRFEKSKHLN